MPRRCHLLVRSDQKLASLVLEDGFFWKESPLWFPHFVHFGSSLSISSVHSLYVK